MKIKDKVVVVTGGASGIGRGLCRRFAAESPKGIVVSDYNADGAAKVAHEIGGLAVAADVGKEADIQKLVDIATRKYGPIDLFCSNAGIPAPGGAEAPDEMWRRSWDIHVMAHVYAARAVLPSMIERGAGYLLQTASAGGLLTTLGQALTPFPSTPPWRLRNTYRSPMPARALRSAAFVPSASYPECFRKMRTVSENSF